VFLEAFANVCVGACDDMAKRADGVDGMNFITQCVASAKQDGHWLALKHPLARA